MSEHLITYSQVNGVDHFHYASEELFKNLRWDIKSHLEQAAKRRYFEENKLHV